MTEGRAKDYSPNPDFNRPVRRSPEAEKADLREYCKNGGGMGLYYSQYTDEAPAGFFDPPRPLPLPVQTKPYSERVAERMEAREPTAPAPVQHGRSR